MLDFLSVDFYVIVVLLAFPFLSSYFVLSSASGLSVLSMLYSSLLAEASPHEGFYTSLLLETSRAVCLPKVNFNLTADLFHVSICECLVTVNNGPLHFKGPHISKNVFTENRTGFESPLPCITPYCQFDFICIFLSFYYI